MGWGVDDRRFTLGYFTSVGGNLVTLRSKKQNVVAHLSTKVEYRGMSLGICEALWLINDFFLGSRFLNLINDFFFGIEVSQSNK